MKKRTRIATQALTLYSAQWIVAVIQFLYAAVTSRAVAPADFGAYATALAFSGFLSILSNGGLGQTVVRIPTATVKIVRSLHTYALLWGAASAAASFVGASAWASLWGNPSAAPAMRWLAISAFISPSLGVANGFMRRLGLFRYLAVWSVVATLIGCAFGAYVVIHSPSVEALVVGVQVSQAVLYIALLAKAPDYLAHLGAFKDAAASMQFSWQVLRTSLVAYFCLQLPNWMIARALGSETLGQWNRADVLATVPFVQLQTALSQTLYPRYPRTSAWSKDTANFVSRAVVATVWIALAAAVCISCVSSGLVPLAFGHKWMLTQSLIPYLAFAAAIHTVSVIAVSALEATSQFRVAWQWHWSRLLVVLCVVVIGIITRSPDVIAISLLGGNFLCLIVLLFQISRKYYDFDGLNVFRNSVDAILGSILAVCLVGSLLRLTNVRDAPTIGMCLFLVFAALIFVKRIQALGSKGPLDFLNLATDRRAPFDDPTA